MTHPATEYIAEGRVIHDPGDQLDYAFRFVDWLAAGDSISDHTITITGPDENLTQAFASDEDDGVVTVWLAGGTVGANYNVKCEIETTDNRELNRSFTVHVRNQ